MELTIALGQAESVPGDLAANLATATRLVAVAAARGARVLALPELFACGYDPDSISADPDGWSLAEPPAGTEPPPGSPLAPSRGRRPSTASGCSSERRSPPGDGRATPSSSSTRTAGRAATTPRRTCGRASATPSTPGPGSS